MLLDLGFDLGICISPDLGENTGINSKLTMKKKQKGINRDMALPSLVNTNRD
jgi:hypothetical protein